MEAVGVVRAVVVVVRGEAVGVRAVVIVVRACVRSCDRACRSSRSRPVVAVVPMCLPMCLRETARPGKPSGPGASSLGKKKPHTHTQKTEGKPAVPWNQPAKEERDKRGEFRSVKKKPNSRGFGF